MTGGEQVNGRVEAVQLQIALQQQLASHSSEQQQQLDNQMIEKLQASTKDRELLRMSLQHFEQRVEHLGAAQQNAAQENKQLVGALERAEEKNDSAQVVIQGLKIKITELSSDRLRAVEVAENFLTLQIKDKSSLMHTSRAKSSLMHTSRAN